MLVATNTKSKFKKNKVYIKVADVKDLRVAKKIFIAERQRDKKARKL